jgi:hypothetical protein
MEEGRRIYSHIFLGMAWVFTSISPSIITLVFAVTCSIFGAYNYYIQQRLAKRKDKREQELHEKEMKEFEDQDKKIF